jgi:hypothetical protein
MERWLELKHLPLSSSSIKALVSSGSLTESLVNFGDCPETMLQGQVVVVRENLPAAAISAGNIELVQVLI